MGSEPKLPTVWPQNSSTRHMASPMMVLRRCPTCISLAMFGLEKSTTTRIFFTSGGAGPFCQTEQHPASMYQASGDK